MTTTDNACTFCGTPVTSGGTVHWFCGGVLPDDPRHAAVSAADTIVRALTPPRVQSWDGKVTRKPTPTLQPAELRARLRPELFEAFNDGVDLALAAGAVLREPSGAYRLAPTPRRKPARPKDDGTEAGLFDLPQEGAT